MNYSSNFGWKKNKKKLTWASASENETNYMILKEYFYRPLRKFSFELNSYDLQGLQSLPIRDIFSLAIVKSQIQTTLMKQ